MGIVIYLNKRALLVNTTSGHIRAQEEPSFEERLQRINALMVALKKEAEHGRTV